MARRRKGDKVNGWLVIDKPLEQSSAKTVGAVQRITNAQKVGHGGTLDPLATGVLPIGLGEATKTMPYIVDSSKEYEFTVNWGVETDSLDKEGTIVHEGGLKPTRKSVEKAVRGFVGIIQQRPPAFSAIKIDGRRAYALAREGKSVEIAARPVEIQSLSVTGHQENTGETSFHVCCGKGTYIRSLARDIAYKLDTYGYVTKLRRTRVGPFSLDHAISLEKLNDLSHSARASDYVLPIATALDDIPAVAVTEIAADRIKCGRAFNRSEAKQETVLLTLNSQPVAMASWAGHEVKPLRVFNME